MNSENWQFKVCNSCGFEDTRDNSKLAAAFESTREWKDACPKCGSTEIKRAGWAQPELDEEQLLIWGKDESLSFSPQDEDILLAENENMNLLFKHVDNQSLLISKRSTILAALCVLLYDNTPDEESDADIDIKLGNSVLLGLKERIELFKILNTIYISDYIKKLVYPRLGLPL